MLSLNLMPLGLYLSWLSPQATCLWALTSLALGYGLLGLYLSSDASRAVVFLDYDFLTQWPLVLSSVPFWPLTTLFPALGLWAMVLPSGFVASAPPLGVSGRWFCF